METIEEKLGRATNYLHDIKVIDFFYQLKL